VSEPKTIWEKMQSVPSVYLQAILLLTIVVPLLTMVSFPSAPTTPTKRYYDFVMSLPEGSVVIFDSQMGGFNYGDCAPGCAATMRLVLSAPNKLKLIVLFESSDGPMFWDIMKKDFGVGLPPGKKYGDDYVELLWYTGGERGVAAFCSNFRSIFPEDRYGTPADKLPAMKNVLSAKDFGVVIASTSLTSLVDDYMRQAYARYGTPLLFDPAGMTVMSVIPYYPFAVKGYLLGLSGGAQLEAMLGSTSLGTKMGNAFSMMSLYSFVLAIIGIVTGYMVKRGRR